VEPSIYHTPVDHANNYTTDAVILYNVLKWSAILTPCVAWKPYARRFYNYYIHFTLYFIQLLLFMSFSFLYLQTLKMLVAVVITYALTWLPLHALTIMGDINPNLYNHMHTHIMWLTFHFVAFSNSGTNPIIYCYMNKTFRVGFNLFFRRIFCINKQTPHARRFTMSVPSTPSSRSFTGYIQYNSRVAKRQRKANGPCMYSTELDNLWRFATIVYRHLCYRWKTLK
jgi:hypothetical protein